MPQANHTPRTLSMDTPPALRDDAARWSDYRRIGATVAAAYRTTSNARLQAWAERIDQCAHHVTWAYEPDPEGGYTRTLVSAELCRVRTCPVCQWRRAQRLTAEVGTKMQAMCGPGKGRAALLLTLTLRNCRVSYLRETIQLMLKAWSKLTRRTIMGQVEGWARSVEVTRGREWQPDDAHPHIHALLIVPEKAVEAMAKTRAWREQWQQVCGVDYLPQCDIRRISDPETGAGPREVLKYSVKPSGALAASGWLGRVALQIDGLRMFAASKTVRISDELLDDAKWEDTRSHVEDLPPIFPPPRRGVPVIISYRWVPRCAEYYRALVEVGETAEEWQERMRCLRAIGGHERGSPREVRKPTGKARFVAMSPTRQNWIY